MLNGEGNKNCKKKKKKKKKSVVDYNVKHSSYTFYGKKVSYQRFVACVPVRFFSLPLVFTLLASCSPLAFLIVSPLI